MWSTISGNIDDDGTLIDFTAEKNGQPTIVRQKAGVYEVTFKKPFYGAPGVSVTVVYPQSFDKEGWPIANAVITAVASEKFRYITGNGNYKVTTDRAASFIVSGLVRE